MCITLGTLWVPTPHPHIAGDTSPRSTLDYQATVPALQAAEKFLQVKVINICKGRLDAATGEAFVGKR